MKVQDEIREEIETNILFDEGSDTTLVQNSLTRKLGLKGKPEIGFKILNMNFIDK